MATENASLAPIYERLNGVNGYHPMSADTFADWSVEAGDMISVSRGDTAYVSPVHSAKIVWRGAPQVTINSTGKEERDTIAKISRRKYGRSGAGMRNDQGLFYDMYDESGHLHSQLELTSSHLELEFESSLTSTINLFESELEMTSSHLTIEFGQLVTSTRALLESELEMTASHLTTEFTNGFLSLHGELEMTASHLETEFTDQVNSLHGELELTASHLQTEFTNGLLSLHGELEMTASHLETEFTDQVNSLHGELELTASHLQTEFTNGIASVHSEVVQTASSWAASVASVADANGNITPASIAIGINASSGQSEAKIDANRVYIGNEKSTTVINGKCSLDDVTATYIKTQIASIAEVVMLSANVTGSIMVRNGSGQQQNVAAGIWDLTIEQSGNTYTLKRKRIMDSDWVDVGSFSRATSLSGTWSGSTHTVSATPQGNTYDIGFGSYGDHDVDLEIRTNGSAVVSSTAYSVDVPVALNSLNSGQTQPTARYTKDLTVSLSGLLQSKTVNSNGTFYPDEGKIGMSSVTVSGVGTPVINHSWSNDATLTVTTTPTAQENLVRQLQQSTTAWSGKVARVPVVAVYGSQGQYSESTNLTVSVDTTSKLMQNLEITENGTYSPSSRYIGFDTFTVNIQGGSSPTINGSWTDNVLNVATTPAAVANLTVTIEQGSVSWDGNTATVNISAVNEYSGSSPTQQVIDQVEVDATARYTAGVAAGTTAGQDSVTIQKGSWLGGVVKFTKSAGTADIKEVRLVSTTPSWSGDTATIEIWDGIGTTAQLGVYTGKTVTVDASTRYLIGYRDGKDAVMIRKGSWSGGVVEFTKSDGAADTKEVRLINGSATWSGNTATVYIYDGVSVESSSPTGKSITVDATERYEAGYSSGESAGATSGRTTGQNEVEIVKGNWSGGVIQFTKSVGTPNTKEVRLISSAPTWNGNTATVVIMDGETASSSLNTGKSVTVDATDRYDAGVTYGTTAGQNSVTIQKGSWSGGVVEFTKSAGTADTKEVRLVSTTPSWSGNTATVEIWDGNGTTAQTGGVYTGKTVTVDASTRYDAGTYSGKASVTLEEPTWNAVSGTTLPGNRTVTVSTTGRTNVGGTTENLSKSVSLYLTQGNWSGNNLTVSMRTGSTSGTAYAQTTVDASSVWNNGYDTARGYVSAPNTAGTGTTVTIKGPKADRSGQENIRTYTLTNNGNNEVILYTTNGSSNVTVAKLTHNKYTTGVYAGKAAVTLTDPTWNSVSTVGTSRTVTVSTTGRTNSSGTTENLSKSVSLYLTQGSWSSNKLTVSMRAGSTSGTVYAQTTVDASGIYTSGETAGKNAVTLNDVTWTYAAPNTSRSTNTVTVTTNGRPTQLSKSAAVTLTQGAWSSGSKTIDITDSNGGVRARTTVTIPEITSTTYTNTSGYTYRADVTIGGVVKQGGTKNFNFVTSAVTLNEPTWNAISGDITSSRTITVSTSGRINASGTATENLSKSTSLYLTTSGLTVYLRTGSTSGSAVAKTSCSDSNLTAGNIKDGVTIFGVTGTYSGSSGTINITVTGSQSARAGQTAVNSFISGATRIFSAYTIQKDGSYYQYYKFRVTCGSASKYYYFRAG